MSLLNACFRAVTENLRYDKNGINNMDMDKSVKEVIADTIEYVESGNGCSSLQVSIYLSKYLYSRGLPSMIILTLTDDGTSAKRASVLVHDGFKWVVMNPVEDIEFFEDRKIPSEKRYYFYNVLETSSWPKKGIATKDASAIPLADFIERYGNGKAKNMGYICSKEFADLNFRRLYENAREFGVDEYQDSNWKIK